MCMIFQLCVLLFCRDINSRKVCSCSTTKLVTMMKTSLLLYALRDKKVIAAGAESPFLEIVVLDWTPWSRESSGQKIVVAAKYARCSIKSISYRVIQQVWDKKVLVKNDLKKFKNVRKMTKNWFKNQLKKTYKRPKMT